MRKVIFLCECVQVAVYMCFKYIKCYFKSTNWYWWFIKEIFQIPYCVQVIYEVIIFSYIKKAVKCIEMLKSFLWMPRQQIGLQFHCTVFKRNAHYLLLSFRTWNLVEGRSAFIKNLKQSEFISLNSLKKWNLLVLVLVFVFFCKEK